MNPEAQQREPEVVIIRRRAAPDWDAPKGGVWKIAFADFMTAMMAFFLVLWLINSSNREVKASLARYFNPLQLSDVAPRRGLQDPKEGGTGGTVASNEQPAPNAKPPKPEDTGPVPNTKRGPVRSEGGLFRDPYAALTDIAGGPPLDEPAKVASTDARSGGEAGLAGGEAFRDPFSPAPRKGPLLAGIEADSAPPIAAPRRAQEAPKEPNPQPAGPPPAQPQAKPATPQPQVPPAQPSPLESVQAPAARPPTREPGPAAAEVAAAAKVRTDVAKAVGDIAGAGNGPKLDVEATSEGLLVSLTDDASFAMFASGSAEPDPKIVRIMERVAQILKAQPGLVVVRGHTDARPFRSATYDNWRLSSARAHMAQYMLIRGGLPEARIERVEGYAERRPKLPANPEAAENRRVEILLRKDKS